MPMTADLQNDLKLKTFIHSTGYRRRRNYIIKMTKKDNQSYFFLLLIRRTAFWSTAKSTSIGLLRCDSVKAQTDHHYRRLADRLEQFPALDLLVLRTPPTPCVLSSRDVPSLSETEASCKGGRCTVGALFGGKAPRFATI